MVFFRLVMSLKIWFPDIMTCVRDLSAFEKFAIKEDSSILNTIIYQDFSWILKLDLLSVPDPIREVTLTMLLCPSLVRYW